MECVLGVQALWVFMPEYNLCTVGGKCGSAACWVQSEKVETGVDEMGKVKRQRAFVT